MALTVAGLKSILDIGITTYNNMLFYYDDGSGELLPVNDVGTLTKISKDCTGVKITTNYFSFFATASGIVDINYKAFEDVVNAADETSVVYFVNQSPGLPELSQDPVPILSARLDADRSTTLNTTGGNTTGVLTLMNYSLCSSSSSSSSSS